MKNRWERSFGKLYLAGHRGPGGTNPDPKGAEDLEKSPRVAELPQPEGNSPFGRSPFLPLLFVNYFCICQVLSKTGMGMPRWMCPPLCGAQPSPVWSSHFQWIIRENCSALSRWIKSLLRLQRMDFSPICTPEEQIPVKSRPNIVFATLNSFFPHKKQPGRSLPAGRRLHSLELDLRLPLMV